MLKKLFAVVAFLLLATSAQARDWLWEDESKTFAVGEVLAALPGNLQSYATEQTGTLYGAWQYATAPADLNVWISTHCARFINQMGLAAVTDAGTCVTTIFLVNGKDPGLVVAGDRWLLPSLENDPAQLQAKFATAATAAATATELAKPLTRGEAQAMLREVVVTLTVDEDVKNFLMAEVGRQIDARGPAATVSSEMVQNALTAYMLEHGDELGVETLPTDLDKRFQVFTDRLNGVDTRLLGVEVSLAAGGSIDTRLTTVENVAASKTGLWVALAALVLTSIIAYIVMFRLPSKKMVKADVTKEVGLEMTIVNTRINSVEQLVADAKTAADAAVVAAHAATATAQAVGQTAAMAQTTAVRAETLALQNFESIHGLSPQQSFPSQGDLDALPVGGFINLVFEADRKQHTLTISRDAKGLKIEGLAGRARVSVTDHKSLVGTITRAFAKAKADPTSAFAVVKAVKIAAAA